MATWGDAFRELLVRSLGARPEADPIRARFGWIEELHRRAAALLDPEVLPALSPRELYAGLSALHLPGSAIRVTNLGRENEAEGVKDALHRLLTDQGGFAEKFRAAKIPQAGVVTLSELLTLAKPHRFVCRNTAFTRALAKVIPVYSRRALEELPYDDFLDLCRSLCELLEAHLAPAGLAEWVRQYRYLLLYAILTEPRDP